MHAEENNKPSCNGGEEPSAHASVEKKKSVDLVTVPLDVLPERCTSTMLPEVWARRSLSTTWPLGQALRERNVGP